MTLIRSDDTTLVENSRNRFVNPVISGASTVGFTAGAGTGGAAAVSHAAGITPPPGTTATREVRATWTTAPTAGFPGLAAPRVSVIPGETFPYSFFARRATAGVLRARAAFLTAGGAASSPQVIIGTSPTLAATAWHGFSGSIVIPPDTAWVVIELTPASGELPPTTWWMGVTWFASSPPAFDGSTPASGGKSYTWAGTPNESESIEWVAQPVVNIVPLVVEGFEYSRPARSILHPILGSPDHDVTFRPGGLRAGRMRLIMPDSASARAAEVGLLTPRVFTLTDPDVSELTMRFVVAGDDISVQLDPNTRRRWVVTVPFQEVV